MKKSVTMKDVAKRANVSVSTVSRVVNNKIDKDTELGIKVWKAVNELNYIPNAAARFMKGQSTGTIGLLLPDLSNPFYSSIASGAIEYAQKVNNNIIIASSNGNINQENKSLQNLSKSILDGLIYCPVPRDRPISKIKYFKNIPTVISSRRNIMDNTAHVYLDNIKGGYISSKYMIRLNRKKICFIAAFNNETKNLNHVINLANSKIAGFYPSVDRFIGYKKALQEAGIPFDKNLVFISDYSFNSGYNIAKKIISSGVDCNCILAPSDLVAAGIIKFLSTQGISVPDDISVVGYGDSIISTTSYPPLTSVSLNAKALGSKCVELLFNIINGKSSDNTTIDVDLSLRESTSFLSLDQ